MTARQSLRSRLVFTGLLGSPKMMLVAAGDAMKFDFADFSESHSSIELDGMMVVCADVEP